jgi:hypothetical protein
MLRIEVVREPSSNVRFSAPVPPARHTLPTVPCDLSEYARAETGPLSWSATDEERSEREED